MEENILDKVISLLNLISGFKDCDEKDAGKWLESYQNDSGHQILNDEDFVNTVANDNKND